MTRYPLMMQHPAHRRGEVREERGVDPVTGRGYIDRVGTSDFMPNVEVNTDEQEAEYRAKGYLAMGETMPRASTGYAEYPKMMTHPEHVDAVPQAFDAKVIDGQLVKFPIPGIPEKFPPLTVHSPAEEEAGVARGYVPGGIKNEDAFVTAHASPQRRSADFHEYPKWVNGVLCDDEEAEVLARGGSVPPLQTTSREPYVPSPAPPSSGDLEALKAQVAALAAGQAAILEALQQRQPPPKPKGRPRKQPAPERADAVL